MFKLPSIVLFFLLFSNSFMVHAEKYCLKEDISKNYVINFFGESYKNEEDRRSFGEGIWLCNLQDVLNKTANFLYG